MTYASTNAAGSLDATLVTHAGTVDAETSVLGLVDLPVVTIRDVGEDCILSTTTDELGVVFVHMWSLARVGP